MDKDTCRSIYCHFEFFLSSDLEGRVGSTLNLEEKILPFESRPIFWKGFFISENKPDVADYQKMMEEHEGVAM